MLDEAEYHKERPGSFGSIHALLNHLLLSDRIWMERFERDGVETPPLNTVLHQTFPALQAARVRQDARIEQFFAGLDEAFLSRRIAYRNSQGRDCVEKTPFAVAHFFNHQTHHRAQLHVMLSQTPAGPPSLDLIRIAKP